MCASARSVVWLNGVFLVDVNSPILYRPTNAMATATPVFSFAVRSPSAAPGSGGVRNGLIGGVRFLVTSGVFDICPYVSFDMPRTGIELVKNN